MSGLSNDWEMVGVEINLESIQVGFWAANGWTTVGPLLETGLLVNGMESRTFLTVCQRGTTNSPTLLCYLGIVSLKILVLFG